MTESKYPADIIDTIAKACFVHYFGKSEHGEWTESGWQRLAVEILDALGLTVTEDFGLMYIGGDIADGYTEGTAQKWAKRGAARRISRRHVLHAVTPWVEVTDDAE